MADDDRRTSIDGDQITDGTIRPEELDTIQQETAQPPADQAILSFDEDIVSGGQMVWIEPGSSLVVTGQSVHISMYNDKVTGNKWLLHSLDSKATDTTPVPFAFDVALVGISYSNSSNNKDIDIEFYKNGLTVTELVLTIQIRNARLFYKSVTDSIIDFNLGDRLSVFARTVTPTERPSDVVLDLTFKVRTNNVGEASIPSI